MHKIDPAIFRAYDIRGLYPQQIDADLVYKIAQAYAQFLHPQKVAVGYDIRLSGKVFKDALASGLSDAGIDVVDIGLTSTDQMYFAVVHLALEGGIQATASHNPKEWGGLKMVRAQAAPISGDSGIYEIRDLVISNFPTSAEASSAVSTWEDRSAGRQFPISKAKGKVEKKDIMEAYYSHVFKFFDVAKFKPFKVVANANYGMANPAIEKMKSVLPIKFVKVINGHLDGTFPKGPSDPLLPQNRPETIAAIKALKPDLGVAWDGDADRCFFFDEKGAFVTPAYINALLAEYYLKKYPGGKVVHDTRVVRVIHHAVKQAGGVPLMNKAGHSFIKERMIAEDAVFGNETSGHYFFKDNFYLDNGLMPFLAMLDILSGADKPFSKVLKPLREKFHISEEINFEYQNPRILEDIKDRYAAAEIDNVDGYDFNFPHWRFNLRPSHTQNLIRLNLEADSADLLKAKTAELVGLINRLK